MSSHYAVGREHDFLTRTVPEPGGSGRRIFEVGVKCRSCANEAWATAKNAGWGRRIFKEAGWSIGNALSKHICPGCLKGGRRQSATIHQLPTAAAAPCPDLPPTPAPEPELAPLPPTPLDPPRAAPEIPLPSTTAMREEPVAQTALAEALQPLKEAHTRHERRKGSRGKPYGFSLAGNARQAAREVLIRMGVTDLEYGSRYSVHQDEDGTWSYQLIGTPTEGLGKPGNRHTMKIIEGHRVGRREACIKSAVIACHRVGIGEPKEGEHFEIKGSPGEGYFYRIIRAPGHATHGSDFLSRFDAKKAAIGELAPHRKVGGAPVEGVDYWITQNGFNLWGWSTVNPNPEPTPALAAQAAIPPEAVPAPTPAANDKQHAEAPRKPTPAENRRIMEALDEHYNVKEERYHASFSDASLAQKLDVPRAWIARVRDEFYGPERNELAEQRRAKLDEALAKADAVLGKSQAVIDALAELETLVAELRAIRAETGR